MKRFHYLAAAVIGGLLTLACEKQPEVVSDSLTVTSSGLSFAYTGGSQTISFETNADWTVSAAAEWVSFDKTSGEAGSATVKLSVGANTDYDERSTEVTISAGEKSTKFSVKQAGLSEFSSELVLNVTADAQTLEFPVTSTEGSTLEIEDAAASWLRQAGTKAAPTTQVFVVEVSENAGSTRSGKIHIVSGEVEQTITVVQSGIDKLAVTFVGTKDFPFDFDSSYYPEFAEYFLAISLGDGVTEVGLALNAPVQEDPFSAIPEGDFVLDNAGTHMPGTFTVMGLEDDGSYHTYISVDGEKTAVVDGEVTVKSRGSVYVISALLYGEDGGEYNYSCTVELPEAFEDDSFAGVQYSATFNATYNTYFETQANEWYIALILSAAPDADTPYLSYFGFTIYGEPGEISGEELPLGNFTFAEPENEDWKTGYDKAYPGTFYGSGNDVPQHGFTILEGSKLNISKNDDGTYNFDIDAKVEIDYGYYDEDWNWVDGEIVQFDYKKTVSNVKIEVSQGSKAMPDGDFVATDVMIATYPALWYGDHYDTGCNTFAISFNYVNSNYIVYLTLNVGGDWTFEKNMGNYCATPFSTGTFTFAAEPGENTIVPTAYSYVLNNYTGTKYWISGGSVDLTDNYLTYHLELTSTTDPSVTCTMTGGHPASFYYARDYTANSLPVRKL